MLKGRLEISIVFFTVITGIAVFIFWLLYNPVKDFAASIPGMDNRPVVDLTSGDLIRIGSDFNLFNSLNSPLKGKWARFRGEDFDNIVKEDIPLINTFGNDGPEILWEVELGEGHAAPVIYNGKAYLLDYNEEAQADALRCFALETGEELWSRWYKVHVKRNHGMSRTIPAINEDYIVTIGPRCHVMCVDPGTGEYLWGRDLVREYGTEVPFWYTGQCPLIDDNIAVFAPGGTSLLIGVDCATGLVVWDTPNPDNWKMSHSSVMPMTFEGKKLYVYFAIGGIVGVSADEEDKGKILWKISNFSPNVVAPSPVIFENGKIFVTAGYGAGAMLFQVKEDNGIYMAEKIQQYKPKEGVASEQQTPVVYQGRMFCILPKDAGPMRNQFVCVDPNNCMKILWTSSKDQRFGLGPYIIADDKFFILNDNGTLTIAEASISEFKIMDQKRIIKGQDAWGPIAIADGYLLMRDSKKMVCLNIKSEQNR